MLNWTLVVCCTYVSFTYFATSYASVFSRSVHNHTQRSSYLEQIRGNTPVNGSYSAAVEFKETARVRGLDVARAGWVGGLHEAGEMQVSVHVLFCHGRLAGGGSLSVDVREERGRFEDLGTFEGCFVCAGRGR